MTLIGDYVVMVVAVASGSSRARTGAFPLAVWPEDVVKFAASIDEHIIICSLMRVFRSISR